jgi:hypothetical protein
MQATGIKMERRSPVRLPGQAVKTKLRDHWPVVLGYFDEGPGPWIVDLSHYPRWDIQGEDPGKAFPPGFSLSDTPGDVVWHAGGLTGRTGRRQAFRWCFDDNAVAPAGAGCTETTEGGLGLALLGKDVLQITEKLTDLDLGDPKRQAPFLLLGPFCHAASQIVVLKNDPADAAVLVAGSRGFAHDMVHAVLKAGEEFGLRSAGESRFTEYITSAPASNRPIKPKTSTSKSTTVRKPGSPVRTRRKKTV